jgi:hypothetical protein
MSFLQRLHLRPRNGEPSKLWLMSETAPFQVPITAYFFILGLINLAAGMGLTPSSVDETYPAWLVIAWSASTLLGAGLSLLGRYRQAFRMESSGLAFLLSACGIYIGAVLWVNGVNALFASMAYVAIGTGCVIRMRVIARHHKAQQVAGAMIRNGDSNP